MVQNEANGHFPNLDFSTFGVDFGGISDDNSSAGVDFFKSGFNGKTFEKIGEFDISKSGMKSYLFGKAIQFRYKK